MKTNNEITSFPSLDKKDAITLWNSGEYTFDKDIGRVDDTAFTLKKIKNGARDIKIIKKVVGSITFARGISPECNIHNAVNRERERILEELNIK